MKNARIGTALVMVMGLLGVWGVPSVALADRTLHAILEGFQEVPAVSTEGFGVFRAKINRDESITYELRYFGIEGEVQQAHIHFAQRGVNGRIVVFLCTNLGNGPAGTQLCPASPGTVTGTITADDVISPGPPPASQGIDAEEFDAFVETLLERVAYVNVHSTSFPGGEIRGQVRSVHHHR
jgi:hypothetical protein